MWYVRVQDNMRKHGYIEVGPDFRHKYHKYGPGIPPPGGEAWVRIRFGTRIPSHGPAGSYVISPNWLERLLGITSEDKVNRAVRKCQKWCDEQNKRGENGPYGYGFKLERESRIL